MSMTIFVPFVRAMSLWVPALVLSFFLNPTTGFAQTKDDSRYLGLKCFQSKEDWKITCNYRISSGVEAKELSAKVSGLPVQIEKETLTTYPSKGQKTNVLVLVDVSDPKRRETIERKKIPVLMDLIKSLKDHQSIAIASFDTDFTLIVPFTNEKAALTAGISSLKATGQATEFYRSLLSAVDYLGKEAADRKILLVMSDGKDEDRAYKHSDVIASAKQSDVAILAVGYSERLAELPFLQTLRKLSDDSFGLYLNGADPKVIDAFRAGITLPLERGGRFTLSSDPFFGSKTVSLELADSSGGKLSVETTIILDDRRTFSQKFKDFYWIYAAVVILTSIVLFFVYKFFTTRRALANRSPFGRLNGLDGSGSEYLLRKTAVRLGRSGDNDIVFTNSSVSLHHAELHRRREGDFYIVDLASTNGVYVNGVKVESAVMKDGDLIELGEVRLTFNANVS
jgi:hypothetical protein